jgi:hypothetical protein
VTGWVVSRRVRAPREPVSAVRGVAARCIARLAVLAAGAGLVVACGPPPGPPPTRFWTDDIAYQVSADPVPPHAREDVIFKVVVRDKSSGQPIDGGEGRIYATSQDGANVWDGLTPGPQAGSYYGKLHFITSGDWAMGLQFRRDSTRPIQKLDWRQEVNAATGEVEIK